MKEIKWETSIKVYTIDELPPEEQRLINAAIEATERSYAPYSHFSVGAAVLMENGAIVCGNNQENAAYPSGMCAERTTLFYAHAQYPKHPVKALAIAARSKEGLLPSPIPPCGACRQVMLETEKRSGSPMRILLYGTQGIYKIEGTGSILPLSFDADFLK